MNKRYHIIKDVLWGQVFPGVLLKKGGKKMLLKGSKTERNILTAFAGESQARNRYNY